MSAAVSCPPDSRIKQLALGIVTEEEIDELESHVLECDHCAAALRRVQSSDRLISALREFSSARLPTGKSVDTAIERARQLATPRQSGSTEDTAPFVQTTGGKPRSSSELTECIAEVLSAPQSPGEIGRLGPYSILKLLDFGGMGMLFLAEDLQLNRRVAVKAMQPRLATSSDARKRFLREARAAAGLRHDHIVTIYHVGEDHRTPWLAMELLEGEPLAQRLKRGEPFSFPEVARIGREIAEALAAAHGRGLMHRDIKPANIWLETPRSRVKVLDFGLARTCNEQADLTQTGDIVGTPAYMSPEQARSREVDHRCDLFSLGCVLYHMLTGSMPFQGKDTLSVVNAVAESTPRPIQEVRPDTPPALIRLVEKLLQKKPANRPQAAAEVAQALAQIEAQLVKPIRGNGLNLPMSFGGARNFIAKHRAASAAIIGAALVILCALTVLLKRSDHSVVANPAVALAEPFVPAQPVAEDSAQPDTAETNAHQGEPPAVAAANPPPVETSAAFEPETKNTVAFQPPNDPPATSPPSPPAAAPPANATKTPRGGEPVLAPPTTEASRPPSNLPSKPAALVSILTSQPARTLIGEVLRENDTHIELADLKTMQPQIFVKADLKAIRRNVSEQAAIDAAGLPSYMAWRIKQLLPPAAAGKIAQLQGPIVFATIGQLSGIEVGQELVVYRGENEIKDPDTGKVLGRQRRKIARLEVTEVQEKISKAKLLGDLETQLQVGDEVEPAVTNNSIAVLPPAEDDAAAAPADVLEELTKCLVNRGVSVVERSRLEPVLSELRRQHGADFDSAKAQQIGKQIGAYGVVVASLSQSAKATSIHLRLVKVATSEVLAAASADLPTAPSSSGTKSTIRKDGTGRATLPAGPRGSRLKWLGGSFYSPTSIAGIAPSLNLIEDRSWVRGDDSAIQEARRAGRPLILAFFRTDYPSCVERMLKLAKENRDVVAAVCLLDPYFEKESIKNDEISQLSRRIKREVPGLSFWVSYIALPAGWTEKSLPPVPPEVDVIVFEVYWAMNPVAVSSAVDKFLKLWIQRAGGRPVVLRWVSKPSYDWNPSKGFSAKPGTLQRCAEIADKYKLAGVIFDHFGPSPGRDSRAVDQTSPAIESIPALVDEIRTLSQEYGIASK